MRSSLIFRCVSTVCVTAVFGLFCASSSLHAQGGEPQYFAIRGATVVPVSGPRMENAEQGVRLAYVELGTSKIELIEPSRPDSPVAKFLERNPKGGLHHVCLGVDDVEDTVRGLAQDGVRVLGGGKPQHNVAGERIAFIHPGDFLGALVELEEHAG